MIFMGICIYVFTLVMANALCKAASMDEEYKEDIK